MMDSVYQGCPQRFIPGAKLTLTAILGIFLVCNLNAQDFARVLNWQPTPTTIHTIDGKEFQQPTFTGASHRESLNLLPVYQEKIALAYPGDVKAQLLNPVYAPVSGLDKASVDLIKETADVKATLTLQRKKPYAVVQILPFRKTAGGQVERLQSFTLRVSVNPTNEARATNDYAANSVLNSGTWFKIAVSSEGVFKVDYNFVKNTLKVDPASFNLNTLAIFGNGGGMVPDKNSIARPDDLLENPTTVVDNNGNNKMDEGDYLLFYAQMPDAWRFNTVTQTFYHEKNLYTDKTFYFLTPNAGDESPDVVPQPVSIDRHYGKLDLGGICFTAELINRQQAIFRGFLILGSHNHLLGLNARLHVAFIVNDKRPDTFVVDCIDVVVLLEGKY